MLQKISSYIRKYQMIQTSDHVIAGVSGGADSVCLLLALLQLRSEFGHTVSAVHVEHGIRAEASKQDAAFVRNFCERQGIECHICSCFVPEYAKKHGMGEEEAGRHLRYAFFREEKKRYAGRKVKIAVAHHQGDNAETMLFHLARGTSVSGLCGIAPVRGDIIRPLLALNRTEIEAFLAENGQEFCVDATNQETAYSRNKIRQTVMPALTRINQKAQAHMYQTAQELREIDDYLRIQADEALKACCRYLENGARLDQALFCNAHPAVQKRMLHQLLTELAGSSRDICRVHILQVQDLFERPNGRKISLPYGLFAVRVYGGVEISAAESEKDRDKTGTDEEKNLFSFRVIARNPDDILQISKKKYTKCFDYDKIKDGFCVRKRLPGDYLAVNDSGDRQKLKRYLVNEKIPAKKREQLLLLADGPHIMWVVGYRISSYYKVDAHTRRILEVTFNGGTADEGKNSCDDTGRGNNYKDC